MFRTLEALSLWLGRSRERRLRELARRDPERAKVERLRDEVRRLEAEQKILRARLRRAEEDQP